jgi:hypothetical protein
MLMNDRGKIALLSPKATASLMLGKNFSLFSIYFGANSAPVVQLADVLGAVDDAQLAVFSKKPASPVFTKPSGVITSAVFSSSL